MHSGGKKRNKPMNGTKGSNSVAVQKRRYARLLNACHLFQSILKLMSSTWPSSARKFKEPYFAPRTFVCIRVEVSHMNFHSRRANRYTDTSLIVADLKQIISSSLALLFALMRHGVVSTAKAKSINNRRERTMIWIWSVFCCDCFYL